VLKNIYITLPEFKNSYANSKPGLDLKSCRKDAGAVIKHMGPDALLGLVGGLIVLICLLFSKGSTKFGAILAAIGGILLAATSLGLAIHAAVANAMGFRGPSAYNYNWTAVGTLGLIALVLVGLMVFLAKGSRAAVLFAAIGGILLGATGLGQLIYHLLVG